jgi:hypothetical protein
MNMRIMHGVIDICSLLSRALGIPSYSVIPADKRRPDKAVQFAENSFIVISGHQPITCQAHLKFHECTLSPGERNRFAGITGNQGYSERRQQCPQYKSSSIRRINALWVNAISLIAI